MDAKTPCARLHETPTHPMPATNTSPAPPLRRLPPYTLDERAMGLGVAALILAAPAVFAAYVPLLGCVCFPFVFLAIPAAVLSILGLLTCAWAFTTGTRTRLLAHAACVCLAPWIVQLVINVFWRGNLTPYLNPFWLSP